MRKISHDLPKRSIDFHISKDAFDISLRGILNIYFSVNKKSFRKTYIQHDDYGDNFLALNNCSSNLKAINSNLEDSLEQITDLLFNIYGWNNKFYKNSATVTIINGIHPNKVLAC